MPVEFETGSQAWQAVQDGLLSPPGDEYRAAMMEADSPVDAIRAWAWDAPPKSAKRRRNR
jgi:hypothetical protein